MSEPNSKQLKTSTSDTMSVESETLFDSAPTDIINYIRQFTGPENVYEVSYSITVPHINEAELNLFKLQGVNIFMPLYFKFKDDSIRAKKYVTALENRTYFSIKLSKFITVAGANNAIIVNGVPHLIFKISNLFNSYQDFEKRVIATLEEIKRARSKFL